MLTRDKKIRLTGFQTIVLIWVGIALVVIIGLVFGPEREPPPPTSEVSYEPRGTRREDDDLPPMDIDWGPERDRKPTSGRSKPAKDSVRLVGMVIDADTDELLIQIGQVGGRDTVVSVEHLYRFEKPVADGGYMVLPHGSGYLIPADCPDELPGEGSGAA